jgi:ketosteroid isomerase-like protein
MRRPSLMLLALGTVGCASAPGTLRPAPLEAEAAVLQTEQDWYAALVRKDAARLESFLAEDFILSGLYPSVETRAQYLQTVQMPDRTLEPLVLEDRRVRIYGDTAVSTGRAQLKGVWNDRPLAITFRYTDVFVLRAGHWLAVASHVSKIEP